MTDTKITALATLTSLDPAADWFVAVDVSDTSMAATGTDKKVTRDTLLADYIGALGKVTATGYNSLPTMFNPAGTVYTDGFWHAVQWDVGGTYQETVSFGPLVSGSPLTRIVRSLAHQPTFLEAKEEWRAETDDGAHSVYATFDVFMNADGTGGDAEQLFNSPDFSGALGASYNASTSQFFAYGQAGQTVPLLDLQPSTGEHLFRVAPDGSVGDVAPSDGWSIKWDATAKVWKAAA